MKEPVAAGEVAQRIHHADPTIGIVYKNGSPDRTKRMEKL